MHSLTAHKSLKCGVRLRSLRPLSSSLSSRPPLSLSAPRRLCQGLSHRAPAISCTALLRWPYVAECTARLHKHGWSIAAFSSTAVSRRSEDHASIPLDDVPLVKNPTPEQIINVFEGLARTQYEEPVKGLYTTPNEYCAAIVRTSRIAGHFLASVDKDEFRSAKDVAPDSRIARGRAALMLVARTAHRWLQEAYPPHAPPADTDLAEACMYFAMNNKLMDIFEAGAPNPVPEWKDICDAIMLTYSYTLPTLEKIAGPIPDELRVYSADVSKIKRSNGKGEGA
ncbi:hypothetical protein FOMPIDRAFT_98669 [Fomitopsis schrenkii]|uniref:Uncharacterized protein n=1 Tax=Fomitopsis schrenkii TaxID=2126942 RepID=S8E4Z6_FOMSC|nr:hypothetical protein FOMPIDRAFT_98669 [Fomitopsis schrenkii]